MFRNGETDKTKSKTNLTAKMKRFCVALSSLAGNVGQVVSIESGIIHDATKEKDIDLQQIKSAAVAGLPSRQIRIVGSKN